MLQTSPSSRRALKTNSIWRWLKRNTCSGRATGTAGGAGNTTASSAEIGPAGEGGASDLVRSTRSSTASMARSVLRQAIVTVVSTWPDAPLGVPPEPPVPVWIDELDSVVA